jgi:hypothetical protein
MATVIPSLLTEGLDSLPSRAGEADFVNALPIRDLGHRFCLGEAGDRAVRVDTVVRFKSLESTAMVLWLGDEAIDRDGSETIYVGLTRAKSLLAVVGSEKVAGAFRAQRPAWHVRTDFR